MGEDCGCVQLWGRVLLFFPPLGAGDGVPWGRVCEVIPTSVDTSWAKCFLQGTIPSPPTTGVSLLCAHPKAWHPPWRLAGPVGVHIPSVTGTPVHPTCPALLPAVPGTWVHPKDTVRPCCPPGLTPPN